MQDQTVVNEQVGEGAVKAAPSPTIIDNGIRKHFGKDVRLGSRKVTVKLVDKFSILPKDPNAKFIRDEVTKRVGSTWKRGTRDVIRGLTPEEENYYLPKLLGVRVESDQWNEKVLQHWINFGVDVPNDPNGVTLEVGFREVSLGKGVVVEPINIDDYMKYNFLREHSSVATEPDQLDNLFMFTYYIVDNEKEIEAQEREFIVRQEVDKMFIKLVQSKDPATIHKIDWILEVAGGPNGAGMNPDGLTPLQKSMELEKVKNKNLIRFKEILEDEFLETKALIRKAVDVGVINQEGNSYFLDAKVIGSSLMQAVGYLSSPANQKDRLAVQERIKQYK